MVVKRKVRRRSVADDLGGYDPTIDKAKRKGRERKRAYHIPDRYGHRGT